MALRNNLTADRNKKRPQHQLRPFIVKIIISHLSVGTSGGFGLAYPVVGVVAVSIFVYSA